jgi:hypothetical protein
MPYRIRAISILHTTTIEEEADGAASLALSITEGIHQLLEGRRALDLEEDLIVIIGDFDVESIFLFWLVRGTWVYVVLRSRHCSLVMCAGWKIV